jgi:hypothetical protein
MIRRDQNQMQRAAHGNPISSSSQPVGICVVDDGDKSQASEIVFQIGQCDAWDSIGSYRNLAAQAACVRDEVLFHTGCTATSQLQKVNLALLIRKFLLCLQHRLRYEQRLAHAWRTQHSNVLHSGRW